MALTILGIPTQIALMWAAAAIFAVCTIVFYLAVVKKEPKNEMTATMLSFLVTMVIALFLMGTGMFVQNMLLVNLGLLAFLVGSVFMLKFPLTVFPSSVRRIIFW